MRVSGRNYEGIVYDGTWAYLVMYIYIYSIGIILLILSTNTTAQGRTSLRNRLIPENTKLFFKYNLIKIWTNISINTAITNIY